MSNWFSKMFDSPNTLNEDIKAFNNKGNDRMTDKQIKAESGEGIETLGMDMGVTGLSSFNTFYNKFFDEQNKTNNERVTKYRQMATMPEISDVLEDAVNESTQENDKGNIIELSITNEKLANNENISKTLMDEFHSLFFERIDINQQGWEMFYNFMRDGKVYYERIINIRRHKEGIKHIKFLSPYSMDYFYNYETSRVDGYIQYTKVNQKKPATFEDAKRDRDVISFIPEQIGFVPFRYGMNRNDIYGYLDNCKTAFNQLKLLETSVIVYRLVRAPERFVFKVDVGNMPRDKALAYVNKIKRQMNRKQTYDPNTGTLEGTNNVNSILDNIWLPQSDNRGSDVTTIGGNSAGFTELDDVKYFAKKLYRSLKYPMSRIDNQLESRSGDNLFRGTSFAEISRDEIKWSRFLERQQNKFCLEFLDLFLLHLEFKGLKKQYSLNRDDLNILMVPPSNYKEQMEQTLLETRFNNYTQLSNEESFSKSYLMKEYLDMDDEQIKLNSDGFKEDKKLFPKEEF